MLSPDNSSKLRTQVNFANLAQLNASKPAQLEINIRKRMSFLQGMSPSKGQRRLELEVSKRSNRYIISYVAETRIVRAQPRVKK